MALALPIHLSITDPVGVGSSAALALPERKAAIVGYGLCQVACQGVPHLEDKGRLEAVIASLLRDATLSVGAVIHLIDRRLHEPAVRLLRGVVEARLIVQRLRRDDGARLADLLAADAILVRKRAFQRQIELNLRPSDDPWVRSHLDQVATALRHPDLEAAAKEIQALRSRHLKWYGLRNLAELADSIGESSSYHLLYAPMSATFVHPGDSDQHLVEKDGHVVVKTLQCDNDPALASTLSGAAVEAYHIVKYATATWALPAELQYALEYGLPLVMIGLHPESATEEEVSVLEEGSGLPREQWLDAITVDFRYLPRLD